MVAVGRSHGVGQSTEVDLKSQTGRQKCPVKQLLQPHKELTLSIDHLWLLGYVVSTTSVMTMVLVVVVGHVVRKV